MYKKTLTILLALVMVLSFAAASQASNGHGKYHKNMFKVKSWKAVKLKDIDSHWANKEIHKMASCGIIKGYEDRTFRPNASVSVGEALMMICRAASGEEEFEKPDVSYGKFPDWARGCLAYALDNGIVDEAELKYLNGNQAAKRWQVAVWVVRAMDLEQSDKLEFGDVFDIPLFASLWVYTIEYGGRLLGIADFLKALVSAQQKKKMNDTKLIHKFVYGTEAIAIKDALHTTGRNRPWLVEGCASGAVMIGG